MNKDTHEELIITTMSQGSGSFGEAIIFTTASNSMMLPVTIPEMTEDDAKAGALFEGYGGHDSFNIINGNLVRDFPTYKKTDTSSEPTGPKRSIVYTLSEKNGVYSVAFLRGTTTAALVLATSSTTAPAAKVSPPT